MTPEEPAAERRRFQWIAAGMGVVVLVAAGALVVAAVQRQDERTPAASSPTPTPTATADPAAVEGARLTGPAILRSGPAEGVAIVTRLAETDAVRVLGRSPDSQWLAVALVERPEVVGWVAVSDVEGVDIDALAVVLTPGATPAPDDGATLTPDLPDLVVQRLFARQNRLAVEIANEGAGDAIGQFMVSINGAEPEALDVKTGEPLRPGQRLVADLAGHYVQARTSMTALLAPDMARPEEDEANNAWAGVVEPDLPNDIEVAGADFQANESQAWLLVQVRNNSPIPVTGDLTVTVREALPSTLLLGRDTRRVTLGPGETLDVRLDEVEDVGVTRITVSAALPAVGDVDLSNNTFPR